MTRLKDGLHFVSDDGTYTKFAATVKRFVQFPKNPIKPDELYFTAEKVGDGSVPMPDLAELVYVVEGVQRFHGLVVKIEDNTGRWVVTAYSMEWLLTYRAIPDIIYHNANLNAVLASGEPATTVGALFAFNSYAPNGDFTAYSATVAKLVGGGLAGCMRDKDIWACTTYPNPDATVDACDGVHKLTLAASAAAISTNQYFKDINDLWLRLGDGSYRENAFLVFAKHWCDTKIRLESIDIGTHKSTIDFKLGGQANKKLDEFFEKAGLELQSRPRNDGLIYWKLSSTEIARDLTDHVFIDGVNCTIRLTNQQEPDYQAAIGIDSSNINQAPISKVDWNNRGIPLFKIYDGRGMEKEDLEDKLQSIIDQNDNSFEVRKNELDYGLRVGDRILLRKEEGKNADNTPSYVDYEERIQKIDMNNGIMILTCGKKLFNITTTFGEYLRAEIQTNAQPLQTDVLTNGAGSVTVTSANIAAGGLKVLYEESFTIPTDGTAATIGAFCDITVNGKIIPPGRIKLIDTSSIKIDITDFIVAGANTIARALYQATGWTSSSSYVKQYRAMKIVAP